MATRVGRRLQRWIVLLAICVIASSCSSETSEPGPTAQGSCPVENTLELLQSGLPTYDYEPGGSYLAVAASAESVVWGRVDAAVRAEANGGTFTEITVAAVVELTTGRSRPDIDVIAWSSQWANRDRDDPLVTSVMLDDVYFVGFVSPWSGVRGGWNIGIEGLYVTCGIEGSLRAVIADARGRTEPAQPTIDDLRSLLADR